MEGYTFENNSSLAEIWPHNDDFTQWTFTLKPEVENHWSGDDAAYDHLEMSFVSEPATKLAMILAKEADIVILPRDLQGDALDAGFQPIPTTNASMQTTMLFNGNYLTPNDEGLDESLPWLDIRIREAINRCIDRETMVDVLYDGLMS